VERLEFTFVESVRMELDKVDAFEPIDVDKEERLVNMLLTVP
jgi:hypothetical protein